MPISLPKVDVCHAETRERAKTEPLEINISGAGDKFDAGLV